MDLATSATKTWMYKPVLAIKGTPLSSGDITIGDGDVQSATRVNCDSNNPAMAGYSNCFQLTQDWVSATTPISKLQIHITSKAVDPAGNLSIAVFDGVPGSAAGTTSINQLDAYSTNAGTQTQVIA
jgi:hypothetical protein